MRISESLLRKIIVEEIMRSINEAPIIRRRGGEETRVDEPKPERFTRREVRSIDDVRFDPTRDVSSSSPFIGGSPAFEKTYNNGKLKVPMVLKRHIPGGIEKFMIFVDAPAINENDIVVVPELLDSGELGAGIVTSIRRVPVRVNGRDEAVPVASVQFPADARTSGVGGTISGIGLAFLVRIGSSKTESGRDKMIVNNSIRRKNVDRRREEPVQTVKYSSGGTSSDDDRRRDRASADFTRDMLGLKRR